LPEKTPLYKIVSEHLETFLAEAREQYDGGLPRYVEQELRAYLSCGILVRGLSLARCRDCGRSVVVAFSCKKRSACCSCAARRMYNTAAHLADRVVPDVPVRQWVISFPFSLRMLLASRADVFGAATRIFAEEMFRWQREQARQLGIVGARGGALCFHHRGGGSMNLHPHVHAVLPDGVFLHVGAEARAEFCELPPPSTDELLDIACSIHQRLWRWLKRHGLAGEEAEDDLCDEPADLGALQACAQHSLGVGELTTVKSGDAAESKSESHEDPLGHRRTNCLTANYQGYSLYVGSAVPAEDFEARERLFRYCARSPLSLERLSLRPDGNVEYRVKQTRHGGQTVRIMTPLQFMARLAALVAPPRHPLLRFFGVFAPNSGWRASVVPVPTRSAADSASAKNASESDEHGCGLTPAAVEGNPADERQAGESSPDAPVAAAGPGEKAADGSSASHSPQSADLDGIGTREPTVGPRFSSPWRGSRLDWATLLKRTWGPTAVACPHCGGTLEFVEVVTDEERAKEILDGMALPTQAPPLARARAPTIDFDPPPPSWD
jgi:hypothetical protein